MIAFIGSSMVPLRLYSMVARRSLAAGNSLIFRNISRGTSENVIRRGLPVLSNNKSYYTQEQSTIHKSAVKPFPIFAGIAGASAGCYLYNSVIEAEEKSGNEKNNDDKKGRKVALASKGACEWALWMSDIVSSEVREKSSDEKVMVRKDFIKEALGITEHEFRKLIARNKGDAVAVLHKLSHDYPKAADVLGEKYYDYTIAELDQKLSNNSHEQNAESKKFQIMFYDPANSTKTDIRNMQADPQYKGAYFQLASNFNRLAGFMGRDSALLEDMAHATAQEEAAVIGTAPSVIAAKYVLERQNLIKGLGLNLEHDGHLKIDKNYYNLDITKEQELIKHVAVGLQKEARVTCGGIVKGNGTYALHEKCQAGQTVNQIFTSALDLSTMGGQWLTSPGNQIKTILDTKKTELARILVKASYEGTIKLAAADGEGKESQLFLTMMGAGVFKNKVQWITEALQNDEFVQCMHNNNIRVHFIYRPDKKLRSAQQDLPFLKEVMRFALKVNKGVPLNNEQESTIDRYVTSLYNDGSSSEISALVQELEKIQSK